MSSDGGGWTRLYYKDGAETCYNDDIIYTPDIVAALLTQDFAVSDQLETLQSEGSWILRDIDFDNEHFNFTKISNVANCKTPSNTYWSQDY